jgi:hypothetical protein
MQSEKAGNIPAFGIDIISQFLFTVFYLLFTRHYSLFSNNSLKHFFKILEAKADPRGAAMGAV